MNWMELIDDHRVFLVRPGQDLWAEIVHGTLKSMEFLRPRRTERLPAFEPGDVLLLYHPQPTMADARPAELSRVVGVRWELSNAIGYGLGPLCRLCPSLERGRLLYACQRGSLPAPFQRVDDPMFVLELLTSGQREEFLRYVLDAGIALSVEEGQAGASVVGAIGDAPGIVEFDW